MFEDLSSEIRKVPMVRGILPFLAGIMSAGIFPINLFFLFVGPAILFVFLLYLWQNKSVNNKYSLRWAFGLTVNVILFIVGIIFLSAYKNRPYLQHVDESTISVLADVIEIPEERPKTVKVILNAKAAVSTDTIRLTSGKLIAYFRKDSLSSTIRLGDRLLLDNRFREILSNNNPHEFNYKRYLEKQGIQRQAFFQQGQWQVVDSLKGNPVKLFAGNLRMKLVNLFKVYGLSGDEFAVASALTIGYTAALDEDIYKSYSTSGAIHVLSVSGLHVGIVYFVLNYLLLFMSRFKSGNVIRALILLLCIAFYAILTGLSPSVLRSATMFSFIIIGSSLKRPANIYNTIAASAFFLILINPNILWDVGFQLSYLAVIGIVVFHTRIYRLLYVKNKLLDRIWALTCVSIGAQIGTFPLSVFYFNQFPNFFLLTNLFVIPLATLILYAGILLLIFSFLPPLATILAFALNWITWFLNTIVRFIESIPSSHSKGIFLYFEQVPLLYLGIILLSIFIVQKKLVYLKLTIVTFILLLGFWSFATIDAKTARQLIIYNVNNNLVVNYLDRKQNILITNNYSPDTKKQIEFIAKRNWTRYNSAKPEYIHFNDSLLTTDRGEIFGYRHFWNFNGKIMVIAEPSVLNYCNPGNPLEIDLLVISGRNYMPVKKLFESFKPDHILISSSVPFWLVRKYEEGLKLKNVNYHNVSEHGAFTVQLN